MQQALTCDEFHYGICSRVKGPRGGVRIRQEIWRRNGRTQTWKTRPTEFRVPVKYGLYAFASLTENTPDFHVAENCPLRAEAPV